MAAAPPPADTDRLSAEDLKEVWPLLSSNERGEGFTALDHGDAEGFFLSLPPSQQSEILLNLSVAERRLWMRLLPPDDAVDVIQDVHPEHREGLLMLLDESVRREVSGLLAYEEDEAGGLMNPRFARVRENMTVDEALTYLRREAREKVENLYYAYVLDSEQKLRGVVSIRELFSAKPETPVRDVMRSDLIRVREETDQEVVGRLLAEHDLIAVPVVDADGRMKGIVTMDDIVDVVQEEATEDIQKMGAVQTLAESYFQTGFSEMVRKRAPWLLVLFLGAMLTATIMRFFQDEIAQIMVLVLFIPLIINSGGNSGSQASTLVIRAMALREVRLRDWWRVARREVGIGLALGIILALIGHLRIVLWPEHEALYGEGYLLVAITIAASLLLIVVWGTLVGAMLPFLLRRFGFDPASASGPLVTTLVDVSGLVIYFSLAGAILLG